MHSADSVEASLSRLWLLLMILPLVFLTGPALAASADSSTPSAHEIAQRVDSYYNKLHSLRASFAESYEGMGISRHESGTMLLQKPGKMRWNYDQPAGKLFLLNGKYGWFYSPGDAQVQRLAASQMDDLRSPLRFLLGHTQLEKELNGLALSTGPGGWELSGVPRGMENRVQKLVLGVAPSGMIQSIAITETDGARTAFSFSDQQPNAATPAGAFIFEAPAGVPVVDGLPPV